MSYNYRSRKTESSYNFEQVDYKVHLIHIYHICDWIDILVLVGCLYSILIVALIILFLEEGVVYLSLNWWHISFQGMIAGHVYYFLEDVYPRMTGRRPLKTPSFIKALFADDNVVVAQPPNAGIGAGARFGAMGLDPQAQWYELLSVTWGCDWSEMRQSVPLRKLRNCTSHCSCIYTG